MNIQEFAVEITKREAGEEQVNIAQTMEILSIIDDLIMDKSGVSIYAIIRKMKAPRKSNKESDK